jgi:hypothetical protein
MSSSRQILSIHLLAAFWLISSLALTAQDQPDAPAPNVGAEDQPADQPAADLPAESEAPNEPTEESDSDAVPTAYPEDRYLTMWDKNPFLLKTIVIEQKVESFAKDWALRGIMASGGLYHVSIINKVTGKSERLKEGDSGKEFRLVSVNYDKNRKKSSVKVARGSETAELTYDDGLLSQGVTIQNTQNITAGQDAMGGGKPGNPSANPQTEGLTPGMMRGPNGQIIPAGAQPSGLRPGMPGYVPGRPGANPNQPGAMPGQPVQPAVSNPGVRPMLPGAPGSPNPNLQNFNGNPNAQPPAPPSVSRRRQLIPAPVQRQGDDPALNTPLQ